MVLPVHVGGVSSTDQGRASDGLKAILLSQRPFRLPAPNWLEVNGFVVGRPTIVAYILNCRRSAYRQTGRAPRNRRRPAPAPHGAGWHSWLLPDFVRGPRSARPWRSPPKIERQNCLSPKPPFAGQLRETFTAGPPALKRPQTGLDDVPTIAQTQEQDVVGKM